MEEKPKTLGEIIDQEINRVEHTKIINLNSEWDLAALPRGHGHYSFGIMVKDGKVLIEAMDRDMAEHIIKVHNDTLDATHDPIVEESFKNAFCLDPIQHMVIIIIA